MIKYYDQHFIVVVYLTVNTDQMVLVLLICDMLKEEITREQHFKGWKMLLMLTVRKVQKIKKEKINRISFLQLYHSVTKKVK